MTSNGGGGGSGGGPCRCWQHSRRRRKLQWNWWASGDCMSQHMSNGIPRDSCLMAPLVSVIVWAKRNKPAEEETIRRGKRQKKKGGGGDLNTGPEGAIESPQRSNRLSYLPCLLETTVSFAIMYLVETKCNTQAIVCSTCQTRQPNSGHNTTGSSPNIHSTRRRSVERRGYMTTQERRDCAPLTCFSLLERPAPACRS